MQITKTEYNKELLTKWQNDILTEKSISEALTEHLKSFNELLNNVTREKNFGVYIKGLLSNLSRKSMEPIALEYMGKMASEVYSNSSQGQILMMKRCLNYIKTSLPKR